MLDTHLLGEVVAAVKTLRPTPNLSENDIHEQIKLALSQAGLAYAHEVKLGARSRIDFMVENIGIELKKGKTQRVRLISQLTKYAQSNQIEALVVLMGHGASIPKQIEGKPCVTLILGALWGVALR